MPVVTMSLAPLHGRNLPDLVGSTPNSATPQSEPPARKTVTICGAGNAAHVLAALVGSMPHIRVKIWDVLEDEAKRLKQTLESNDYKLVASYSCGTRMPIEGKIEMVTTDAKEAVSDADMLTLAVPAFAHGVYLQQAGPYLHDNMHIGALVAQGGFDWSALSAIEQSPTHPQRISLFACETLPWACRLTEFGKSAEILGTKEDVDISVQPSEASAQISSMLESLVAKPKVTPEGHLTNECFPHFHPTSNFLTNTLMNINSVWHPCICYGRFGPHAWDQKTPFTEEQLFYEGVDDVAAKTLTDVSNEVLAVKEAIERQDASIDLSGVTHVFDWIKRSYPEDIVDRSTLKTAIVSNKAYKGLKHKMMQVDGAEEVALVPDPTYRYFSVRSTT